MSSLTKYRNSLLEEDTDSGQEYTIESDSLLFDFNTEDIACKIEDILEDKKYETLPLKYEKSFSNNGKQGVVGLFEVDGGKKCVWKISQHLNYLVEQENSILKTLCELREYCPHFVQGFGKFNVKMSSDYRKVENPFEVNGKHYIYNDVLLMEYVDQARKFYRYLKNKNIEEEVLYTVIKQTLLAIIIAQQQKGLSHYDLHSNNILIKTCNPNSVFLYIIDENTQYMIPTYGYYPVIIDFGFGYTDNMKNGPLWGALAHTDVGFLSNMCDKWADPKLFLVTVSDEIKNYRKTKTAKTFRRLVKNIFQPLTIDWESGWDSQDGVINCSDKVYNLVKREGKHSKFFKEMGQYCIDILQSLIKLPLKKRKYGDIEELYRMIVDEFHKIELEISSNFYNLYIFKQITNAARSVMDKYSNKETMKEAVTQFRQVSMESITQVAKYCNPKLNWDKLLCSMIVFSRQMEGVMFDNIETRMKQKNKEYNDLEVENTTEVFEALEVNIPSKFIFDKDTKIYVWDAFKKHSKKINLNIRQVVRLNELGEDSFEKAKLLKKIYLE